MVSRKISFEESITYTHSALCKEWHPTLNGDLKPELFSHGSHEKIWWKCSSGNEEHIWETQISIRTCCKSGCPYCAGKKVCWSNCLANKFPNLSKEWDFVKNINLFPSDVVCGTQLKVWWKCANGHEWKAAIADRTIHQTGCRCCSNIKQTKTQEMFILDAKLIHGEKYLYDEVKYINAVTKISIICLFHGIFFITPNQHLSGRGCRQCANENSSLRQTLSTQDFIKKAIKIHKNEYEYSKAIYTKSNQLICITCYKHGDFFQTANNHLRGQKCPYCVGKKLSSSNRFDILYPNISKEWHPIKNENFIPCEFSYGSDKKIWWICGKGHEWEATISNRTINGRGCPKCSHNISKPETEWLNSLNIPEDTKHRQVIIKIGNKKFKVDGFEPDTKTIYLFHGDYWHGNPDIFKQNDIHPHCKISYKELFEKTKKYEQYLLKNGYKLIIMWENNFRKMKEN